MSDNRDHSKRQDLYAQAKHQQGIYDQGGYTVKKQPEPEFINRYSMPETDNGHAIWDRQEQKFVPHGLKQPRKPDSTRDYGTPKEAAYGAFLGQLGNKVREMNAADGGQMRNPRFVNARPSAAKKKAPLGNQNGYASKNGPEYPDHNPPAGGSKVPAKPKGPKPSLPPRKAVAK
jgi:hypothetical protein